MTDTDTSAEAVERLAHDCDLAASALRRSPSVKSILHDASSTMRTLRAENERLSAPILAELKTGRFNDRIIKDGFPDGWFIQDRLDTDEALLCRRSDFAIFGFTCICTRPRAITTDNWVKCARLIAKGFDAANNQALKGGDA